MKTRIGSRGEPRCAHGAPILLREIPRLKHLSCGVLRSDPDYGLWRIPLAIVDEYVPRRIAEWVVRTDVESGESLECALATNQPAPALPGFSPRPFLEMWPSSPRIVRTPGRGTKCPPETFFPPPLAENGERTEPPPR